MTIAGHYQYRSTDLSFDSLYASVQDVVAPGKEAERLDIWMPQRHSWRSICHHDIDRLTNECSR